MNKRMKKKNLQKLATTVTVIGAAAAFTSAPAFAEELEPEQPVIVSEVYEEEAVVANEAAQEVTADDLAAAEDAYYQAEDEFQNAASDAYGAFNQAKEDAESEVMDAEDNHNQALKDQEDAWGAVVDAQHAVTDADNTMNEVVPDMLEAERNKPDSAEIDAAEAEKNQAEQDVSAAEEAVKEAESAEAESNKSVEDKQAAVNEVDEKLHELHNAQLSLMWQIDEAQEAVDLAEKVLAAVSGEGKETPEYKEAMQRLEDAKTALQTAKDELDALEEAYRYTESSELLALKEMKGIDLGLEERQPEYDRLKNEAETAAADLESKTQAAEDAANMLAEKEAAVDQATAERDQAKEAADSGKIDPAVTQAEAAKAEADKKVETAKSELDKIKGTLDKASEIAGQGFAGFIDWMLAKDDLTDAQRRDLKEAQEYLKEGLEHTYDEFSEFDPDYLEPGHNMQITNMNDPQDAIALEKLKVSLGLMRDLDALRLQDENYAFMNPQASTTNFATMASAAVSADRAAGTFNHTIYHTMAEGLAWGYNPVGAWYNHEKNYVFDRIKDELGITEVKNYDDLNAILNKADENGEVVGHYAYLFLSPSVVMGIGHTDWNNTSSYGVTPASYVKMKYSFDEFEALLDEYMKTLDINELEKKVEAAQDAYDQALADQKAAADTLSMIKAETGDAAEKLQAAEEKLAEANAALEQAKLDKEAADTALEEAKTINEKAGAAEAQLANEMENLKNMRKNYEKLYEDSLAKRAEIVADMEKKQSQIDTATQDVADKESDLAAFDEDVNTAKENYDKAVAHLAELQDEKDQNTVLWNQLHEDYTAKYEELQEAVAAAAEARNKKADALNVLQDAQAILTEKEAVLTTLKNNSKAYEDALKAFEAAKQVQEDAKKALEAAQLEHAAATERVEETSRVLETALIKWHASNNIEYQGTFTPVIEDGIFDYLNTYIDTLKEKADKYKAAELNYVTIYEALAQQQPGDQGEQQPGDQGQQQPGDQSEQQPGDQGQQQPGDQGQQQPGNQEMQKPEEEAPAVNVITVGNTEVSVGTERYNFLGYTDQAQASTPKTGDASKPAAAAAGMIASGGVLAGIFEALKRRKHAK